MKQLTIILISLLFTVTLSQADKKTSDTQTVKELVQKVKQSHGDERRKAMNALKVQLRSMNQATRQKVMMDLQKSFAAKQQESTQQHTTQKSFSSEGGHSISPAGPPQISAPQTPSHTTPSISPSRPQMPSPRPGQQGGRR